MAQPPSGTYFSIVRVLLLVLSRKGVRDNFLLLP